MENIKNTELRELEILRHVEETPVLNNRMAAGKLKCSVKLAHSLLSKMVEKGLLSVKKYHSRRWDYFLTPAGIAEKARLTYEFLDFSMQFYHEARKRSSQLCRELAESGHKDVAIAGTGELAEIVYLGIKEWNLKLKAVYSDKEEKFLGEPCHKLESIPAEGSTPVIMCFYDRSQPMKRGFVPDSIQIRKNMHWIFK